MNVTHLVSAQRAFFRLGWLDLVGYPATFALQQISQTVSVFIQLFVSRLVPDSPHVGNDYSTFVIIGLVVHHMLAAGLRGFGSQMDTAVQQGRLETLLVQPIKWKLLPLGMVQFTLVTRMATVSFMALLAAILGARFEPAGIVPAILVVALGFMCVLSIGILGGAVKILTKRSDPILAIYGLVVSIFSGVLFPIDVLPGWMQPVSYTIPQTYIISAVRQLLMADSGDIAGPSMTASIVALVVLSAILYPIAFGVFARVTELARRLGILAGY